MATSGVGASAFRGADTDVSKTNEAFKRIIRNERYAGTSFQFARNLSEYTALQATLMDMGEDIEMFELTDLIGGHQPDEADEVIEISTLSDIVGCVPPESLDAFLVDLKNWVELQRELRPLVEAGLAADLNPDVMAWVDDGKNDVELTAHVVEHPDLGCMGVFIKE